MGLMGGAEDDRGWGSSSWQDAVHAFSAPSRAGFFRRRRPPSIRRASVEVEADDTRELREKRIVEITLLKMLFR
jgi:hypothetical protein